MTTTLTFEQIVEDYSQTLGPKLGRAYAHLLSDFSNTLLSWRTYRQLFGTNRKRVELLNRASGPVAVVIERALFEGVVLSLCRIADPASSGRGGVRTNLTLRRIAEDPNAPAELHGLIDALDQEIAPLRQMRDKAIAHRDLPIALKAGRLDGVSRAQIETVIARVKACFGEVDGKLLNTHRGWDGLEWDIAEHLFLETLFLGVQAREERPATEVQRRIDGAPHDPLPDWLTNPARED